MSSLSYTRNSVIHTSQLEMLEKGDMMGCTCS